MIKLVDVGISKEVEAKLKEKQAKIDAVTPFHERVIRAKAAWAGQKNNKTFDEVKEQLTTMCSGPKRCGYCEDSAADEIEHIAPKDLYPELTFVWANYLYACGPCNGPKSNRYDIFRAPDGVRIDPRPSDRNAIRQPTPAGEPLLVNPREEDPLDFLWLDLNTFVFTENADDPTSREFQRAEFTVDVLKLNERDDLIESREEAYEDYLAHLKTYVKDKVDSAAQDDLMARAQIIKRKRHPTVWKEMQRQHKFYPALERLFDAAPEAMHW